MTHQGIGPQDIYQQLYSFGYTHNEIKHAMQHVTNSLDINEIIDYLSNDQTMSMSSLITNTVSNSTKQPLSIHQTPYKLASSAPAQNSMFTLLLSSVVIAGGTYFLYRYLFTRSDEDEYPPDNDVFGNEQEEDDEDPDATKLRIFFGSQSGTAEGFAFDMEKEGKQFGFSAKAIDLEDYDPESLQEEELVIFLVATYGEGEPTDNAQEFYNWLSAEDDRTEDELTKLQFAVFGLGNSQYEFFNAMGKQFDKYLEQYGGTRIYERGEGDDDIGSIEDQFGEWKEKLWPLLCKKYLGIEDIGSMQKFECSLDVETIQDENDANYKIAKSITMPYDLSKYDGDDDNGERINKKLFLPTRAKTYSNRIGICRMLQKQQLRQNTKDGSTLHIDFDLTFHPEYNAKNPIISYKTADNMGFIVRNDYKQVDKLCKRLGLRPDDIVRIKPKDSSATPNYTFPEITSIRNLFLWYLDINGSPGKKLLTTLAGNFTKDAGEKEEITKLCEDLQVNVVNEHLTLLDVFEKYKSIEIDIGSLIEILKPLQPRLYTISSSSDINPNKVSICIKLEQDGLIQDDDEKESDKKQFKFNGVCSNYLIQSKPDNKFQFYMEESKFKLPTHGIPVIMIGVGAGLAPFAAFIDEGDASIRSKSKITKKDYGEWWLFFGCRYKIGDYIYKEKLEKSLNDQDGVLTELKVAFSREQKKKIYVQNLIEENQEKLWELIHSKKARIYVCGGVAMGKAVRETFTKIFTFYDKSKDGHKYLDDLLKHDIYVQELWG